MNNRGQSLVIFVLMLPIIVLILAAVIDMGSLMLTKHSYETEIKSTIEYGLKNFEEEDIIQKMQTLLDTNIDGYKDIHKDTSSIRINVKDNKKSMFLFVFDTKYKIDITYTGYIENGKTKIVKS